MSKQPRLTDAELAILRVSYPRVVLAASDGSEHERILRLVHPERAYSERWISAAPLFGIVALLVVAAPLAVFAQLGTGLEELVEETLAAEAPFAVPDPPPPPTPAVPGVVDHALPALSPPDRPLAPPRRPAPDPRAAPTSMIDAGARGVPAGAGPTTSDRQRDALSVDDLIAMRIHGVTPEFVRELDAAGYSDLDSRELTRFKTHGVTPSFILEMEALGYASLSPRELVRFRVHGVTPAFIREMHEAGFGDLTPDQLVRLRISGVDSDLIHSRRLAPGQCVPTTATVPAVT